MNYDVKYLIPKASWRRYVADDRHDLYDRLKQKARREFQAFVSPKKVKEVFIPFDYMREYDNSDNVYFTATFEYME